MANQRLSSIYYDFIPTSFISQSVPINYVIQKVISNAITGKYGNFDNNEYFPNSVTLTPFVKYMEEKDAVQIIDEFYKKQTKIKQKYERDRFCMEKNLEIYSKNKATCFLVLGKPTSKRYKVAKFLAQKTKRHHLDVVRLVAREIIKKTPLGNWMWANLVWGKKIPDSIPMMLLLDELGKKTYQRRGYVLSGLPIISSCDLNENLLPFALGKFPCVPPPYISRIQSKNKMKEKESTHITNIFDEQETNLEEITEAETFDGTSEEISEEEWSSSDDESEYPGQEQRRLEFTKQGKYKLPLSEEAFTFSIEHQLSLLLDLDMPPDVVVYLNMEDNEDIITTKPNPADADKLKLLIQLDRYEVAFKSIQNFLLHYSKETMIKIDGRLGQKDLFQQLENRLQYLNYKRIHDVEWLFPTGIPEQIQKPMVDKSLEDCLQILCETHTIQNNLIWLKPNSQTYCPVETCRGKRVRGNLQFAVMYLGCIYLISSLENMKAFISEPEKYIFFQPNCRIAIIGPARSGKSTLAKLLKFLLKGEIYDVTQAICKLCPDKCENKYAQAFQWAFSQAKNLIKARFEYCINLRNTKLQEWKENVLPQIKQALDTIDLGTQAFSLDNIESILLNSKYFNEILPEECKITADYKDLDCSDPTVNFFLHEKLVALYAKSLLENYHLASDFITFAQAEDERVQINTNGNKIYGQWILDGAPLDLRFWEKLEENNCLPNVVIFLSNSSEEKLDEIYGRGLNRKFTSGRYVLKNVYKSYHCHYFAETTLKQDEFVTSLKLIVPVNECISKYSKFLASIKFTENVSQLTEIEKLEEYLKSKDIPLLTNNLSNCVWGEVMSEALLKYLSLFKSTARPLSYNDLVKLSKPPIHVNFKNVGNDEEEMEESLLEEMEEEEDDFPEEAMVVSEKNILKNVRLGSLGIYCPVLFTEYDVLIKGRQNICIDYENLVYFFYSQECLSKCMCNPQKYLHMHNKPSVPAVKIWIMGPNTTEKSNFSLFLSEELRTKSISFYKQDFKLTIKVTEETSLDILHDLNDCVLLDPIIKKLRCFLKSGAILTGFPLTKDQFNDMIANSLYPEAIFMMDDQESLIKALYSKELELRKQKRNTSKNNPVYKKTIDEDEDIESEIISENTNESNSDNSEYRELTESDKKEIYELCKSTVDAFYISERQMTSLAKSLNIPVFKIPKNFRNSGFLKSIMRSLYNHHDRSSVFDQVLEVSENIAMLCLDKGIFRYSRFGKSCPVDVENLTTVNHFIGSMKRKRIFPCIYREHIYFINGKKNLCKFKINPFKYVNTCSPHQYSVPLRIAIFGPPASGCTTLCNRISKEFGMRTFVKEDFEALLSRDFHWTKLYQKYIDNKNIITEDILAHCLMLNENATPNGIVLDNFTLDISHILKVARYNVDFHIILLLAPSFEDLWRNWRRSTANLKSDSVRQLYILFTAYSDFMKKADEVMNTTDLQLFNIFLIKHMPSKWASWCETKSKIFRTVRGIVGFESNIANQKCSSLSYLNIFDYELNARFAPIDLYCPICVINKKLVRYRYDFVDVGKKFYDRKCQEELLRPFGYNSKSIYEEFKFPHTWSRNPNYSPLLSKFMFKRNLFLYQKYSYWSCDDHLIELLLNAPTYLPLSRNHLPPYMPLLVLTYLQLFVEHEGLCVVTYFKHLPNKVYVKGDSKYAVYYKGKVFLVASEKEALEFLHEPQKYYRVKLKLENTEDVDWDLEGMKFDLGSLTGSLLTTTIVEAANVRPKHFAMDAMESVAVQMALHLKIQNNALSPVKKIIYQSTLKAFLKDCCVLQKRLYKVKKIKNPFIVHEYQDDISENSEQLSTRRVPVPDERFDFLCEYFKPLSKVPAFLNVVDIAGLVKGAAEGQGLGNAFLSHISACDAIFHLCRAFDDTDVTHVEGEVDPVRDLDIISEELRLKDEERLTQYLEKLEKTVCRGGDKKSKPEFDALVKIKAVVVDEKKHIRFAEWNAHDIEVLNKYLCLTSKPVIYLVNLTEKDFIRKKNKWLVKIKEWVDKNDPGASIIPFSAGFEQKLSEMEETERKAYENETKCKSVLDKIIITGYKALQLEYFFTAGADEVKAWTIQKGTKAPQAAGKIHTDFEKGFIMAEVMHYKDFKEEGSEAAVKSAGKYRQQGRNYGVEDGDIIFFKFNAGAGLKDAKKK